MSPQILSFASEFDFFTTNFSLTENYIHLDNYDSFLYLSMLSDSSVIVLKRPISPLAKSILGYIDHSEDCDLFNNVENLTSLYHYSVPNVKLYYPEPFIAAPSFMHSDIWFVHILSYQYWLWFIFIFIIVFFFLTFVCTVRWCNMRVRPRRETRGVSRSKCGDLITACVPVTWATSIIVNESTDAIDYYDGFGTTELVVGIRAYQWGWEYYYPKDIDLNYNVRNNYSAFIGNSLKYEHASGVNLKANNLWKFYQNRNFDQVVTPAHILALPMDNYKLLNFMNFNDLGTNGAYEINAFKRVRSFSKTYTSNLTFVNSDYSSKYKHLSNLYLNDNMFTDSYLYGQKRQHNFLSTNAILNNQSTFMNPTAINKVINFNCKNNLNAFNTSDKVYNYSFFRKPRVSLLSSHSLKINDIFLNNSNNPNLNTFTSSLVYNSFLSAMNDNSDKKKIMYPIYKFFNLKLKKREYFNLDNLNKINNHSDLTLIDNNMEVDNLFSNKKISYKTATTSSPNQAYASTGRFIRNFIKTKPMISNFNHSMNLNPVNTYLSDASKNFGFDNTFFYNASLTNWADLPTTNHLSSVKTHFDYPSSPIISNHPHISKLNYDKLTQSTADTSVALLQTKEDLLPGPIFNVYWNAYWNNSTFDWRLYNNQNYHNLHQSFYLPMFNFYYDYDFRNWQSLELLEDSFWESMYSAYTHEEYTILSNKFDDYESFNKTLNFFNWENRNYSFKYSVWGQPFTQELNAWDEPYYANPLYVEDLVTNPSLLATKDFFSFPVFSSMTHMEDSYESIKFINHLFNLNSKIFLNLPLAGFHPHTHFYVFDFFRDNTEDFSWFMDENNMVNKWSKISSLSDIFGTDWRVTSSEDFLNAFSGERTLINNKSTRFGSYLTLRAPIRSSIVTYNAIQKVFRNRFDENRAHAKLNDLSSMYLNQPLITSPRIKYEKLLGKTKESFFKINLYKNNFQPYLNNLYGTDTSLNFYFYDFPFLFALKSDSSRYMWFDWYAKWGFYEVQPSSASRYAIFGMPYFSKNFEFGGTSTDVLNESESYFTRLSRARRNYLPNWIYTPYVYAKNSAWYKTNLLYEILDECDDQLDVTRNFIPNMDWYWSKSKKSVFTLTNKRFFPSHSGINSYGKLGWRPKNSIQSYYYNVSSLVDILTRREFLYRNFLSNNNKIVNLPIHLTSSPSNPLIAELKSSFLFVDPISYQNEYSREIYYSSLKFFNYTVLKSFLMSCNNTVNLSFLTDFLFSYFFSNDSSKPLQINSELYKSQYRPLRKGITNMIRLQATGAIAMPIEIRLQILASSKDVIHSWAIPSAGIKIDCVPGYSSHKVMIFLVSGIYWGQCMEICGRYHHWMPIVIYFMKRDLFFLWCTHFVFASGANNMWTINDRQFTDYVRVASFDKYSWLSEINL